jgi:hypothetical protein
MVGDVDVNELPAIVAEGGLVIHLKSYTPRPSGECGGPLLALIDVSAVYLVGAVHSGDPLGEGAEG